MVASWRFSRRDVIGIPRPMRGDRWIRPPSPTCAESGTGPATAAWMIRTDRPHICPARPRTLPRGPGRTRSAAGVRKEFIEGRGRLSTLRRAVPHARGHPRAQRFRSGGDSRSFGRCSAVAHSADPTLPHPLSTAKTINTVAGRPPLLAQRPARPVIPIPQMPYHEAPASTTRRAQVV